MPPPPDGLARIVSGYGSADELPVTARPGMVPVVSHWLLTLLAPGPAQYALAVLRLSGLPARHRFRPQMTHELTLLPVTAWTDPARVGEPGTLPVGRPALLAAQFPATDAAAHALAANMARAIICGGAPVHTPPVPGVGRRFWACWLDAELSRLTSPQEAN